MTGYKVLMTKGKNIGDNAINGAQTVSVKLVTTTVHIVHPGRCRENRTTNI